MQKNDIYNSLKTRGKTLDDIFIKINKSVNGTVTLAANTVLNPADPLVSTDGGKTFVKSFEAEYDDTKADYKTGALVINEGVVFEALVDNPEINTIDDAAKWKNKGLYVVNGAAMITHKRETKDLEESFKCAVAVDCELSASSMVDFNESCRVAGFPNILMR